MQALRTFRRLPAFPQELSGVADRTRGDLRWSSRHNELTSFVAGIWPEIEYPIGSANNVEIVLDYEHRVTGVY